ncbi:MAG: adenylate/guanylate cyclase domain-containing protein [Tateyamaria sp.]|uniref:adenylate/guanylate cyclase domain-containing protein n=1 Tax=Tateyamaria sp. TaxID=1929288 RepID=UPI0032DDF469
MRIGLHTGDVIEAGDDFFGTVVNKAARVATAAEPDEILASDATRVMIGGAHDFIFVDSTEVQLKEFKGSHMVRGLTWQT